MSGKSTFLLAAYAAFIWLSVPARAAEDIPSIKGAGPVNVRRLAGKAKVLGMDGAEMSFDEALDKHAKDAKVVVIDMFATWCGPCRSFAPYLAKLHDQYGKKGMAVIAVSSDDSLKDLEAGLKEMGRHPYPILLDTPRQIGTALSIPGFPTATIMRPDGTFIAQGLPDDLLMKKSVLTKAQKKTQASLVSRWEAMHKRTGAEHQAHIDAGKPEDEFKLSEPLQRDYDALLKEDKAFNATLPKPELDHRRIRSLLGIQ